MKAAQFNKYGDISVIEINENAKKPQVTKGQILVEVHAAGVNPIESTIRNGFMQQMIPLQFPVTTGGDFSGTVSEVGEGVTDFKVGDEVYGVAHQLFGGSGTAAEYVAANSTNSGPKPNTIDHIHAAALPLVGTSAVQALEEHINLQKGQKILIHGGAGGIGSIAIQIAKSLGAYVATTVNSNDVEFAKNLGADEVIDYKTQDFTTIIKDYDAVYTTVREGMVAKSIPLLKSGGILVSMAEQPDENLAKEYNVTVLHQMSKARTAQLKRLKELVDEGKVKPIVDNIFTLYETKDAYDALEKHPRGKVVIKIK